MKKATFILTLIFAAFTMTAFADICEKKGISYKKIEMFMEEYYNAYNLYAQDSETIDLMDEYWAPEFIAISYFPLPKYPTFDLIAWKNFLVTIHFDFLETLFCDELSIDTKKMTTVSRLTISFYDRYSGQLVKKVDGIGYYDLKVCKRRNIKITKLRLFFSDPSALMELAFPTPE